MIYLHQFLLPFPPGRLGTTVIENIYSFVDALYTKQ